MEQSYVEVSRRYFANSIPTKEEVESLPALSVRTLPDIPQGSVAFGAGLTINIGNFESVRVDVRLELPCSPEEVNDAFGVCQEFVETKLAEQRDMINSVKSGGTA